MNSQEKAVSVVTAQDRDKIDAKLKEWQENPEVKGFACILISRNSQDILKAAIDFHGLWSQEIMSKALKRSSNRIFSVMADQDAAQRRNKK